MSITALVKNRQNLIKHNPAQIVTVSSDLVNKSGKWVLDISLFPVLRFFKHYERSLVTHIFSKGNAIFLPNIFICAIVSHSQYPIANIIPNAAPINKHKTMSIQ